VKKIVMCRRRQSGTPLAVLAFAGLDRNQGEELMTCFRHAAILSVLAAGTMAASAQTKVITREQVESRTVVATEPLQLTPVQRRTVYRTIVRDRVVPAEPTIEYRVGARVPDSVRLYSGEVAIKVPTIRSYKHMVLNNRVVLVDPATSQVTE
jgi:hypothetical protein